MDAINIADYSENLAKINRFFIAMISICGAIHDANYVGGNFSKSWLDQNVVRPLQSNPKNALWDWVTLP